MHTDILLAVWNRYFDHEQLIGFERNALSVFWVGNTRPPVNVRQARFLFLSWFFLRLHFVTGAEVYKNISKVLFNLGSQRYWYKARLVWAYMEYNTLLIDKCRRENIPTILDVPIGHQWTCREVLSKEFALYNVPAKFLPSAKWVERYERSYHLADQLVVGSTFVKQTMVDRGIAPCKITVNPYGVDTKLWCSAYNPDKRARKKLIFVYTASVSLRKGIQYLLKAWKTLHPSNAELWICGTEHLPPHPDFQDYPSSVVFCGRQTHEQLAALYRRAHVYVLPSLFEGLARSGIEAMAAGLPAIVTWESGLTDLVQDGFNGWVVPSRNANALAECLHNIISNPSRLYALSFHAFDTAQAYTWDAYGDRCAAIVREAIVRAKSADPGK